MARHLSDNSIISPHQHGFLRGLSCETQLITIIHEWARTLNSHGQVDIIFLDFAKAFDVVPHERLLLKARYYGFRGKLLTWLRSFLSSRRQRVVVNGLSSCWSPVKSGVPQGTVLGPILFLLFINDLSSSVSSGIKLFADDCVLYRNIISPSDHSALQKDLQSLEAWAASWQMSFSPKKCMAMTVTLKRFPSYYRYSICNVPLEGVQYQKYLGVYITSTLNWSKQCEEVKKKANRVLGILQRNLSSCSSDIKERAYLSLVRPLLEYGTTAWSPSTKKDINTIESVQRRAARFVRGDYQRTSSVTSMLASLHWPLLQTRRNTRDLEMFFKIYHGLVLVPFPSEITSGYSRTRGHNFKLRQISSSINAFRHSFFVRTIPAWNSLSSKSVQAVSLAAFKAALGEN